MILQHAPEDEATPLRRRDIVLTKLAVAVAITTVVSAAAMFLTGVIIESARFGLGLAVACVAGSIAYSAVFIALSLLTRRPVLLGVPRLLHGARPDRAVDVPRDDHAHAGQQLHQPRRHRRLQR